MGKKSGPPPPDYTAAAEKTAASNNQQILNQTYANRPTETDAFGNTTSWNTQKVIDPSTGQAVTAWSQNTTMAKPLQDAINQQLSIQSGRSDIANELMGNVRQQMLNGPVDFSGMTQLAQGAQAGNLQATTNPYGFGPRQQNINTRAQQGPQLATGLDYSNLQNVQGSGASRDTAYNQLMDQATSRLDPQWNQRQSQMESQLANQGITRGSAAYDQAMQQFGQQRNDAYNQAMMSAQTGATQQATANNAMDMALRQQQAAEAGNQANFYNTAQGQMFGFGSQAQQNQLAAQNAAFNQSLAGSQYGLQQQAQAFGQQQAAGAQNFQQQQAAAQYQNQLRQQQIAEAQQQQNWSLNALNALLTGQQVTNPQFQNFNQAQAGQGVDYSGAANSQFQAAMQQQQMQNQAMGQIVGAVGGIGGAMMGNPAGLTGIFGSDKRMKTDIHRIRRDPRGFNWYRFRFYGESMPRVGVMAQEVARVMPEAVINRGGILHVDYGLLN